MNRIMGAFILTVFIYGLWRRRDRDLDITNMAHPDSWPWFLCVMFIFFGVVTLMLVWR